jgi:beta-phosphoglucomutase-like phosphatase (HAD superfamily)
MASTMPAPAPAPRIFVNAEGEPLLGAPRAVIFDLDGVLADLCEMHRDLFIEAFNEAVAAGGGCDARMTPALHAEKLEGLSTKTKLAACRALFPAAVFDADAVSARKQARTIEVLAAMTFPTRAQAAFAWARGAGLQVAVYTNSIRATLDIVLRRLGIAHLCDVTLSNEDVPAPKPSPSGYLHAFALLGRAPHECLIFEDSLHGLRAARGSGATVIVRGGAARRAPRRALRRDSPSSPLPPTRSLPRSPFSTRWTLRRTLCAPRSRRARRRRRGACAS